MKKRFSLSSIATLAASFALVFCLFPLPSSADRAYEFWVSESDEGSGTNVEFKRYWYQPSSGTTTWQETFQVTTALRASGVADRSDLVLSGDGASLSWNAFSTIRISGQFLMSFDLADRTLSQGAVIDTGNILRSTWTPDAQSFYTVGLSGQASPGYVESGADTWTNIRDSNLSYHAIGFYNDHLYLARSAGRGHGVYRFNEPGLLTTPDNPTTQLTGTGWDNSNGGYSDFAFLGKNFLFTVTRSLNEIQVFRNENPENTSGWDLYKSVSIDANPQRMSLLETGDGAAQIFFTINESATETRQLGTVSWEWNEGQELWEFGDVDILLDVGNEDRWFQGVAAVTIIPEP